MTRLPLSIVALLLLFAAVFFPPTVAEIKSLTVSGDSRPLILFEKFGFTHAGHANVSVSSVSVVSPPDASVPDSSRFGFFLLSDEALLQVILEIQQNLTFCILDSHYVILLFTFRDLSPPPRSQFENSYRVSSPNEYSLFFVNCAQGTKVSMEVRTTMYNLNANGSKDYLPAGLTRLPSLNFIFSLCYLAFLCIWVYLCWINKHVVHRIHLVMAVLVLMKALNLICAAEDKHYIKVTGTPHGWDVLFYIFQFIRVVLFFTVIVLIGTGWSFLKPFLQGRDKKVLMIVIPLQVLANIASIVMGDADSLNPSMRDWIMWKQVFFLVDIISSCAVIVPIVWSIRKLRETSKTDGKAARNLAKLTLFRRFYFVVIGYMYFTTILVFGLGTVTTYEHRWVSYVAEEVASLAFYTSMFYMFRPVEKNEYFVLNDEDDEAIKRALKDNEFEL